MATTAFVLSGGGSLGAVQVGMLQALHARTASTLTCWSAPPPAPSTPPGSLGTECPPTPWTSWPGVWAGLRRSDIFPVDPRQVLRGLTGRSRVSPLTPGSDVSSAATQASPTWRTLGCRPTWWPRTCSAAMTC